MSAEVKIEGLKQFQKNLKALDKDLPKALRIGLNDAANIVVDDAKPRVAKQSGRARSTVKARSTQKAARVVGGGNRAPYYPWLDFGGRVGRRKATRRPVLDKGRYIYPSYFKKRDDFLDALGEALRDVAEKAGFEVT